MTRPYPSVETFLVQVLKSELGSSAHVAAEVPHDFQDQSGLLPLVVVDRISGADLDFRLDRPVVDIDVYGPDRTTAQGLAERIRIFVRDELPRRGATRHGSAGVVVTRARTIVAPRVLPHPDPRIRRYSANYELILHTTP